MINIKENYGNKDVLIEFERVSELCWTAKNNIHNLTTAYYSSEIYTNSNEQLQFHGCWEVDSGPYPIFGLGLYKFTAKVKLNGIYEYKDHFYIDYRTSAIPNYCPAGCDYQIDFSVYNGVFRYVYTTTTFPENVQIWNLVSVPHITTGLEPLPPENLQNNENLLVELNWEHSSNGESYWTNYAIYRSIVSGCNTQAGNFTKIATISADLTRYTDYRIIFIANQQFFIN